MKIWKIGFCILIVIAMSAFASALSAEQCFKLASNKDKAAENMAQTLQYSGNTINPCTGLPDTYSTYYELNGITHIRTVYGNGDAKGYLGLTLYLACQDGSARVMQRIYGPVPSRGIAWGFYFNFPFDDYPSTWIPEKEVCNTIG